MPRNRSLCRSSAGVGWGAGVALARPPHAHRHYHTGPCLGGTGATALVRPCSCLKQQAIQEEPPFCTPTQQPACSCRERTVTARPVWLARAHPDVLVRPIAAPLSSTVSRKRHLVNHLGDCRRPWGLWVGRAVGGGLRVGKRVCEQCMASAERKQPPTVQANIQIGVGQCLLGPFLHLLTAAL